MFKFSLVRVKLHLFNHFLIHFFCKLFISIYLYSDTVQYLFAYLVEFQLVSKLYKLANCIENFYIFCEHIGFVLCLRLEITLLLLRCIKFLVDRVNHNHFIGKQGVEQDSCTVIPENFVAEILFKWLLSRNIYYKFSYDCQNIFCESGK